MVPLLEGVLNMKLKKYFVTAAILLALTAILLTLVATVFAVKPTEGLARQAVETYARVEFELGDPEKREKIIKFSPERAEELKKKSPEEWIYVTFGYFDRIVVASYKLDEVKVTGTRATARLIYRRLAHADGDTDDTWRLIPEPAHDESVTLNLVFDKGWHSSAWSVSFLTATLNSIFTKNQWWVLDPPVPRISKQAMINYYSNQLKWYEDRKKEIGNLPTHQQDAYTQKSGILQTLRKLP